MSKLSLLFVLLLHLFCLIGTDGAPKNLNNGLIIGGNEARPGQFPYMVAIQIQALDLHWCGGSILTRRTILTAAHCMTPSVYVVFAGSNDVESSDGRRYAVSDYINNPDYGRLGRNPIHDTSVVYLEAELQFTPFVQPIELDTNYLNGEYNVTLSGWGSITFPDEIEPTKLQYLNTYTISQADCARRYSEIHEIHSSHLCTYLTYGQAACYGDSGSPLVMNGKQVGVTSWAQACAVGYPDVFIRITSDLEWINSVTI